MLYGEMKDAILSALRIFFGVLLLLVGIVGNVLPIIPGILFMVAGLLLLASELRWVHNWLDRLEARYPKVRSALHTLRKPDGSLNLGKLVAILLVLSAISLVVSYFVLRGM